MPNLWPIATHSARETVRTVQIKPLERDIQRAILDYCAAHRIFVQRRNVAGMTKIKDSYIRLGTRGQCDLWGIKNGMHWECEVKRQGKEPTPEQWKWIHMCWEAGARAFWCDSLEGFIENIEGLG